MTILDALQSGPLRADAIAQRIGQDITDTYALLVSAEARGEVRVITTKTAGIWRGEWESMDMGTPTTAMNDAERMLVEAGTQGLRTGEIAKARGINCEGTSRLMRRLMEAGKAARLEISHRHVRYYAPQFAPEDAERMAPKVKERLPVPPKRVDESTAMQQTLAVVADAKEKGASIPDVCASRGCADGTAFKSLRQLMALGEVVNVRHAHRVSLYYLPKHAPKASQPAAPNVQDRNTVRPQRLTSIRDANVTMPQGEPIITAQTKITRIDPPPGRFDFKPPKGWTGQITRDWRERLLGAQR